MSDNADMIPKAAGVPADPYVEDPNYDEENSTVDPNTKGESEETGTPGAVQVTSDTNISGAVETSTPAEDVRTEEQK